MPRDLTDVARAPSATRARLPRTRRPAPLLAVVDVREVNLHDRRGQQFERVANRVRVMGPRSWVDNDTVCPVERVVAPIHVLAFVVRLPAPYVAAELGGPFVNSRLELVEGRPAVDLRIPAP